MKTLVTPSALVLAAAVVFSLGALTLYLVYRRHGKPSTPQTLHPGERKGLAILAAVSASAVLAAAVLCVDRHDSTQALICAGLTVFFAAVALAYAIRWPLAAGRARGTLRPPALPPCSSARSTRCTRTTPR
ncbi:hypothetical protein ACWGQ5_56285 [Streptomyces sp. NPDC055722]